MSLEKIYDNRYRDGYREKLSGYEYARWSAVEHFVEKVNRPELLNTILDFGSGSGLHIPLWKKIFPGATLHFAEISAEALDKLKFSFPEYQNYVHLLNDGKTQFRENTFDVVVSIEVMEHVEHLQEYLIEIFRILKPGGMFIWTTPCGNRFSIEHIYSYFTDQIDRTAEGYRRWRWEDPAHIRRLKSSEIRSLLKSSGYGSVKFRFRAHFFSFVCSRLLQRGWINEKSAVKLMKLDYKLFRLLPNAASMIGSAWK